MRRALLAPPRLALALLVIGLARAQTPAPPAAPPPDPVPPARPVSPGTAAKLAAVAPKFIPPKPAGTPAAPDLRETDKPHNTIVRLPSYLVQEPKIYEMKEREMLTPSGRVNLGYRRHPGLRFGSLPFLSNDGVALAMLEEEERLERLAELTDLLGLLRYDQADVKQKALPLYLRSHELIDTGESRLRQK